MFFSKKKKRKRFLCLRILCFFGIKDYSVPQNSNELLLEYYKKVSTCTVELFSVSYK